MAQGNAYDARHSMAAEPAPIPGKLTDWRELLRTVFISRALDALEESQLVPERKVLYQFCARGHDVTQALLAQRLTGRYDAVAPYYRSRPLALGLGLSTEEALASTMMRAGGMSGGRDIGVVINRPTPVPVDEVLPDWSEHVTGEPVLYAGGPVGTDSALAVASLADAGELDPPGFRRVHGGLGLVDLDTPPEILVDGLDGLRVFAGYAGWGPGQLDAELNESSWLIMPVELDLIFEIPSAAAWEMAIRRLGADPLLLQQSHGVH